MLYHFMYIIQIKIPHSYFLCFSKNSGNLQYVILRQNDLTLLETFNIQQQKKKKRTGVNDLDSLAYI